jgi:hypothetical protein
VVVDRASIWRYGMALHLLHGLARSSNRLLRPAAWSGSGRQPQPRIYDRRPHPGALLRLYALEPSWLVFLDQGLGRERSAPGWRRELGAVKYVESIVPNADFRRLICVDGGIGRLGGTVTVRSCMCHPCASPPLPLIASSFLAAEIPSPRAIRRRTPGTLLHMYALDFPAAHLLRT